MITEAKRTVTVYIEEHLVKEVEVEIPDNVIDDPNIIMQYAEDKVTTDYRDTKICLNADDRNGVALISSKYNDIETEWHNIW